MKYINNLYIIITGILCLAFLPSGFVSGQDIQVNVSAVVQDNNGNPVPGASVNAQEGRYYTTTDNSGSFSLSCAPGANVLIEAEGYASYLSEAKDVPGIITLEKSPFHLGEKDIIQMPFGKLAKRRLVGAVSTIRPEEIEHADATQSYTTALAARALGLFGGRDVRGMGYIVIVDGVRREGSGTYDIYSDWLNLQEIAEISVLKDAASRSLYGADAKNGIILITTKRGQPNRRIINVFAESGFGDPVSMPKFLKAADYMELYNEALSNDGLAPRYDQTTIDNTRSGVNLLEYPDQEFYTSEFLKSVKPFNRVITEFSGGSMAHQYYLNMGWNNSGSLLNMGEGANERSNQFNLRGNIDIKINDYIKAKVDGVTILNNSYNPYYADGNDFWAKASSVRPNDFTHLIPASSVLYNDRDTYSGARMINGTSYLGGSSLYTKNIYGDLYLGGFARTVNRLTQINVGLDIDLGAIVPELKYKTYFGFDSYNDFIERQENNYAVYNPAFTPEDSVSISSIGVDNFPGNLNVRSPRFYRRTSWFNVLSYQNTFNDVHNVDIVAMSMVDSYKQGGRAYNDNRMKGGLRINYMFDKKYVAELNGSLVGSPRFDKANRWGFAPSAGLAWIISEEDFLQDLNAVNYLKIKGTFGNIKTDYEDIFVSNFYLYNDTYRRTGSFTYADGAYSNSRMQTQNIGNPDISWIERNELNIGTEASLFNNSLFVELNYFRSMYLNGISQLTNIYPAFLGGTTFLPFENYTKILEQGYEAGLNYQKKSDDFTFNIGLNLVYYKPVNKQLNELDYSDLPYRDRLGKASDAIWGLEAIGLFRDEADILAAPVHTFGDVQPGDIKYRDQNGDDIIDDRDEVVLGNSHSRYNYVLNLGLKYKNFDFFMYVSAQTGRSSIYNNSYYWVYGDRKYPEHIRDNRWAYDPVAGIDTRATATYPRLSSSSNANNFQSSTFWLSKRDYLSIPLVQLTYTLPNSVSNAIASRSISVFARATDLLIIAKEKEKIQLNTAGEPQMRMYSLGLKVQF